MNYWNGEKRNCVQYRRHFLVDNRVFHVERCMSVMQSGTQMIKLKRGTKGLVRLFYLDEHRTRLRWRPSRKSEKAKILIDSIYKVTEGRQSEIFHRQAEGNFDPSCCFTIYHGNHMESLDLITSNPEEARTWITGLKYLMAGISDEDSLAKRQRTHDQWVKQTFEEADKNGDGLLNIEEIHQLMHKLNVNLPRRKVRQMFQEADTDENQGTLTFEEFCVFYKMMSLRRDLYLLLLSYSDKKDHLTVEELAQFLKVEQKMSNVTLDYCLDIIMKFEVSEENKVKNVLGIEGNQSSYSLCLLYLLHKILLQFLGSKNGKYLLKPRKYMCSCKVDLWFCSPPIFAVLLKLPLCVMNAKKYLDFAQFGQFFWK